MHEELVVPKMIAWGRDGSILPIWGRRSKKVNLASLHQTSKPKESLRCIRRRKERDNPGIADDTTQITVLDSDYCHSQLEEELIDAANWSWQLTH